VKPKPSAKGGGAQMGMRNTSAASTKRPSNPLANLDDSEAEDASAGTGGVDDDYGDDSFDFDDDEDPKPAKADGGAKKDGSVDESLLRMLADDDNGGGGGGGRNTLGDESSELDLGVFGAGAGVGAGGGGRRGGGGATGGPAPLGAGRRGSAAAPNPTGVARTNRQHTEAATQAKEAEETTKSRSTRKPTPTNLDDSDDILGLLGGDSPTAGLYEFNPVYP
jgi:hypothetical protein